MIALVQPLTASFQAARTPARPQSRAAVKATYDPMFAPMMLEGFPAVPIYEFGAGTPLNALSSPQLWAQGSPDWSAMMGLTQCMPPLPTACVHSSHCSVCTVCATGAPGGRCIGQRDQTPAVASL